MSDDLPEKRQNTQKGVKKGSGLLNRLFGTDVYENPSEEDVVNLLNACMEKGIIENNAKIMIENIFSFDDTAVAEIMTHRRDMVAVEDTADLKFAVEQMIETGYSRIPVYHDDTDNIVGVLYAKDLLKYICADVPKDFKLTDVTREAMYVPAFKNCNELFTEMTKNKVQLAIVVDEYGGTNGLITLEDLIEAIVGNIQDEYDDEEEAVKEVRQNTYMVDGAVDLVQIEELLGVELPTEENDTVAGLMLENLDKMPQRNEKPSVEVNGIRFTVTKMEGRRIARVLVKLL